MFQKVHVIDSHTGGEPTRVVVTGGPDLGAGTMLERRDRFRSEFDDFRSGVVREPRGSDVLVGAILCDPVDSHSATGLIFFNNAGTIGMCGHGTIGVVKTLEYLGRIECGEHRIETPVGPVTACLRQDGSVSVRNVASFRLHTNVELKVPDYGTVIGDVAWGGNWFFLVKNSSERLSLANVNRLTAVTLQIRKALEREGVTGEAGAEIDHIEIFGAPVLSDSNSRNFVLCPGAAYDRSPCGTGCSAKLACLAADGVLEPGQVWRQESIVGSVFEMTFEWDGEGRIIPTICGTAHITGDNMLIFSDDDPFRAGIGS